MQTRVNQKAKGSSSRNVSRFALLWLVGALSYSARAEPPALSEPALAEGSSGRAAIGFGVVKGVVTYHGPVPKALVPDDAGLRRDLVEVDPETRGLLHVAAHLVPAKSGGGEELASSAAAGADELVVIDQVDHTFVPHLVAVRVGQVVHFTNSDPANHNVRTTAYVPRNQFNVFTGVGGSYKHRFDADPKGRPIRLGCDIHPWMSAWIYVFDHPLFAVTDEQGRFCLGNVPPGEYRLVIEQPDLKYRHEQRVEVTAESVTAIEIQVKR
jgi:plastocyanin